jgi:hypothetical protein
LLFGVWYGIIPEINVIGYFSALERCGVMKMSRQLNVVVLSFWFGIMFLAALTNSLVSAADVCPDDGGWKKVDSGELTLYPVDGATRYCFKAGPFRTNTKPDGGFGQDGACEVNHIERCELSHWSYFIPGDVPTPTSTQRPSPTPTDQPTPTPTDVLTSTPTDQPNGGSNPTPTPTDRPGGGSNPTPTPTDSPNPTNTPGSTATPVESSDDDGTPEIGGQVLGTSDEPGEVVGLTTYADTGTATELLIVFESALGILLTGVGAVGYNRVDGKKKK